MLPQAKPQETRMLKLHKQESKKVSVDDGFTAIPNELLDALMQADLSVAELKIALFVYRKTAGWHKETDWICDEQIAQYCGLASSKVANNAKIRLIKKNVLIKNGKEIGLNLYVSEWKSTQKWNKKIHSKVEKNPLSSGSTSTQEWNTKGTITKYKINTPHTPQGDILPLAEPQAVQPDENFSKSQELVDYYNELNKTKVRDGKPFIALLKNTSSRKGYSVDEIKLVLKWVHHTWKKRNGSIPSPTNICRPTRFDGYLADAQRWAEVADFDTQAVIQAYNDILGDKLVPLDEDDTDAEQQILALLPKLAHQTVDAFSAYFRAFANNASEFYFEPSRKIGFSFLMKPETLTKVKRGEI